MSVFAAIITKLEVLGLKALVGDQIITITPQILPILHVRKLKRSEGEHSLYCSPQGWLHSNTKTAQNF